MLPTTISSVELLAEDDAEDGTLWQTSVSQLDM